MTPRFHPLSIQTVAVRIVANPDQQMHGTRSHAAVGSIFRNVTIVAMMRASRRKISGMFSIVYQGMTTRILSKMKIEFTSSELQSQIYIDTINWMLLAAVLVVMFEFRSSENLASAYGLAVSGSMLISAIMMAIIFLYRCKWIKMIIAGSLIIIDGLFFISTPLKIPHGASTGLLQGL